MSVYLSTSLRTILRSSLLGLFLLAGTAAYAQENIAPAPAIESPTGEMQIKVEEVPDAVAPTPDANQLKDTTIISDATGSDVPTDAEASDTEERMPVPMLEEGDYEFGGVSDKPAAKGGGTSAAKPDDLDPTLDAFFDTDSMSSNKKKKRGPPKPVDPDKTPGSKLIIVEDVTPKTNISSQIVAAERAVALGRYDSALQLYDKLYDKNKKDAAVLMGRAVCLQKLGRFDEAMQSYEQLSDLQPKNIDVKINMLGLLATRYPSIALRRLLDLHEENQDHVGIVAQIAVTAANLGDFDTAMRYLGMAMGIEPNNASHVFNTAVILDRAGQTKDAITYYEKALEVDAVYGGNRSVPREVIYERLANIR